MNSFSFLNGIINKKNTLLLTVIAVATLLVAVVGATFAYFSLSATGSANTTAKVTTGKVGVVSINGTKETLTLKVTPQDMAQPSGEKDEYYYAVTSTGGHNTPKDTGGIWEKQDADSGSAPEGTTATLANITRTGGDENDSYTCGYKVTISSQDSESLKKFKSGNLVLTITGDGISEKSATGTASTNVTINDFSDFNGSKELHGKVKLDSDTEELGDQLVSATLYLVNKKNEVQNDLNGENNIAGLDVTLTFNVESEGSCTITSTPAE